MKYIPTIINGSWSTTTTTGGNQGIHNQRKFKDGVAMLESAIESMTNPKLVHTVLTGSDPKTYNLFIQRFKRRMTDAGVNFDYKGCDEISERRGQHIHVMWIVDTNDPDSLFDVNASDSTVSEVMASVRRIAPSFNVFVCDPQHHDSFFIPLAAATLYDAADYLSYIYKARSKQPGHRYLSSRSPRRHCPTDRTMPVRLADRLINVKYAERPTTVYPYSKRAEKLLLSSLVGMKLLVLPRNDSKLFNVYKHLMLECGSL